MAVAPSYWFSAANEAVLPERRAQIVELGGLELLLPLTQSPDIEVQRLAAHALANLSVLPENQVTIAEQGGVEMLIPLLSSSSVKVKQQAAKGLANLGVNVDNKRRIADAGGIIALLPLLSSTESRVVVESIAALANLAVDDDNEAAIGKAGALGLILNASTTFKDHAEVTNQCARALRNLSVNGTCAAGLTPPRIHKANGKPAQQILTPCHFAEENKEQLMKLGAVAVLQAMAAGGSDKLVAQCKRALTNLGAALPAAAAAGGRHK